MTFSGQDSRGHDHRNGAYKLLGDKRISPRRQPAPDWPAESALVRTLTSRFAQFEIVPAVSRAPNVESNTRGAPCISLSVSPSLESIRRGVVSCFTSIVNSLIFRPVFVDIQRESGPGLNRQFQVSFDEPTFTLNNPRGIYIPRVGRAWIRSLVDDCSRPKGRRSSIKRIAPLVR